MILNIVGTPFSEPNFDGLEKYNVKELYQIAFNNKIGLLFLESLAKENKIGKLQSELNEQKKRKELQQNTWERTVDVLNKTKCKYAVIKSIFPFSAIPNDIDILILGDEGDYRKAIDELKKNQFHVLAEAALEINLRDATTAKSLNPLDKEWVDIDIYKEVGAGHLIYMNKNKLKKYVYESKMGDRKIGALKPYAEVATTIFHAMYPERVYTLLLHLFILHTIKHMTPTDEKEFLKLCSEQKINNCILNTLRITEYIQEICFGESSTRLTNLRKCFGEKKDITINRLPLIYPFKILFNSLWGKMSERVFAISVIKQIFTMFNPKTTRFVIKVYKERAVRDGY